MSVEPGAPKPSKPRSIVYIDGFNLYNGLAKPLECKWVDLQLCFERILSNNDVIEINFYTSLVVGPTASNQAIYTKALRSTPKMRVHWGQFQVRSLNCSHHACTLPRPRSFERPVEKKTDVALGIKMLADAIDGRCDQVVLVSGDSDFVPAIEEIRRRCPTVETSLYVPSLGIEHARLEDEIQGRRRRNTVYAKELRDACHKHNDLPIVPFLRSQFQNPLHVDGEELRMPATWKLAQNRAYQDLMDDLRQKAGEARRRQLRREL